MTFELDHFFILTEVGAPAAQRLIAAGLIEGPPNTHPGQGTANRRFFFANAMLELLWVHDATEAATGPARRCCFAERASDPAASPFGLVFRRTSDASADSPFPGWKYEPDYLDPPLYLHVGGNSENMPEPLCVYMPFAKPPEAKNDSGPIDRVSHVRVTSPCKDPSEIMQKVAMIEGLAINNGACHLMEVTFNLARENRFCDLTPDLPLILRW